MKRTSTIIVSYFITGIGGYYILSGGVNFFSMMIVALGLIGISFDVHSLKTKQYEC